MKWREIASRTTGFSGPGFGISWTPPAAEVTVARRVIQFLEDRRVLYNPYHLEVPEQCVHSVVEIRKFITTELGNLDPMDAAPLLLKQVATLLIDTAMRPEECLRLKWENHRDGSLHILGRKTASARRVIPLTERAAAILEARKRDAAAEWVFPAPTGSGHIEKSSLKKQHLKACGDSKVEPFPLYTLRHACLTRWARTMDPYTLAYLAGHSDFATTRRYVHPQADVVREALHRALGKPAEQAA